MRINLIVALCKNNGIGLSGSLPWNIKEDMKHFYNTTVGKGNNAVVMGRKTWESLQGKPLKNRFNFVLTRNEIEKQKINTLNYNNLLAFCSINDLLNYCNYDHSNNSVDKLDNVDVSAKFPFDVLWVIGGNEIYKQFSHLSDMYVITYIDKYFDCDTFFQCKISDEMHIMEEKILSEGVKVKYLKRTK